MKPHRAAHVVNLAVLAAFLKLGSLYSRAGEYREMGLGEEFKLQVGNAIGGFIISRFHVHVFPPPIT